MRPTSIHAGRMRSGLTKGPQNLSRAKTSVHKMMLQVQNSSSKKNTSRCKPTKTESRDSMFRDQPKISRKEKRKQARKMRKMQRSAYHTGQSITEDNKMKEHRFQSCPQVNNRDVPGKNWKRNKRKKLNRALKLKQEKETARKHEELALANKEDDRTIKKLEKDLHFRKNTKTKSKIIPSVFKADGLDYLLDLVNSDSEEVPPNRGLSDSRDTHIDGPTESNNYEHTSVDINSSCEKTGMFQRTCESEDDKVSDDKEDDSDDEGEYEDDDSDEGEYEDDDSDEGEYEEDDSDKGEYENNDSDEGEYEEEEDYLDSDAGAKVDQRPQDQQVEKPTKRKHCQTENICDPEDKNHGRNTVITSKRSPEIRMDPYGNVISEDTGKEPGLYIPPKKRAKISGSDEKKQGELDRLRKQLKGLINRLSESNIQSISTQIRELYLTHSRNDMNEMISHLVLDSCIGPILTSERLVMEHVMLIALLSTHIGSEVGAHFIETLAGKLDDLYKRGSNYGDGKQCDNAVLLFTHLYNFRVIHCTLVYDIIHKLVDGFTERDIEMLLLILKNAGLMLRKDDPSALKEIVMQIQTKACTCSEEFQQQSRVKFMLETISAIRNNNVRKIPNFDPALLDHMRKILRSLIKAKGQTDADITLRVSLENLLNAKEKGRWWIIGSSWEGKQPITTQQSSSSPNHKRESAISEKTSDMISELSRQQRMNTDLRKAIFSVIMTAEDYADAFEKVLHLRLKAGQEREVVYVLINCCLQEASFNPYYAHLGSKLCQHDRKYKMAFQFTFWDKFKILDEMSRSNLSNLALLLSQMLISRTLSISVLKVIEFADINKVTVCFLRQTLRSLLLQPSQQAVVAVFSTVTSMPKLRFFCQGLRLFLLHLVLPTRTRKNADVQEQLKLKQRVELANQTLAGGDNTATF